MSRFPESVEEQAERRGFAEPGNPAGGEEFVRPEFMILLGLLPPYSTDDVHKAYKARALKAHPDRGGSKEQFVKLQEAYEQAQEYVRFSAGRRLWLANQVEPYLQQQEIIQEIESRHGSVQVEKVDWMQRSFGDFATLAERLREIDLRDATDGDEFLKFLGTQSQHLRFLTRLDLSGSDVTDAGLIQLRHLRGLQRLNVARTRVSMTGMSVLAALPDLAWINVGGTSIGWFGRWRLARRLPHVKIVADPKG
jgi:DnaJ domain